MLPDFIDLKVKLQKRMEGGVFRDLTGDALLSRIRHVDTHEGDSFSIHRCDGTVQRKKYKLHEVRVQVSRSELREKGIAAVVEVLSNMKEQMTRVTHTQFYKVLEEETARHGNVLERAMSGEALLEVMERQWMTFDDDDQPELGIICHPSNVSALTAAMRQIESEPELKKRHDAILAKKRKEWRDREANRKLVD